MAEDKARLAQKGIQAGLPGSGPREAQPTASALKRLVSALRPETQKQEKVGRIALGLSALPVIGGLAFLVSRLFQRQPRTEPTREEGRPETETRT